MKDKSLICHITHENITINHFNKPVIIFSYVSCWVMMLTSLSDTRFSRIRYSLHKLFYINEL
jgi:hypothetical protein